MARTSHHYFKMTSLESFTHRKVVILHQDVPVDQAARAMCEKGIGCVLVCDEKGHLAGIVTDRDLVCLLLSSPEVQSGVPLSEVMTTDPISVNMDESVEAAVLLMEESGVRRLPIVQTTVKNEKKCVGIISLDDLIASKQIDLEHLARIIRSQTKEIIIPARSRSARAEARTEAHISQTLNHFYKVISEKTHLDADLTTRLTQVIFESIIARLHFKGAAHFIAQLPRGIHEDLLDLPAGPNRKITANLLITNVASHINGDAVQARFVLTRFFDGLSEVLDKKALEYLWGQLPYDFRRMFSGSAVVKTFGEGTSAA